MTTIVGGLRDRLIVENIRNLIEAGLDQLGWFDEDNALINNPLEVRTEPIPENEEITPNVVVITDEDVISDEFEMGNESLTEDVWEYAIDIFAEDNASGKHLCGDIRALLEGKFKTSVQYSGTTLPIFDLTAATPSQLFTVEIDGIVSGRQRMYAKPYQKHWWTIVFTVTDVHGSEDD